LTRTFGREVGGLRGVRSTTMGRKTGGKICLIGDWEEGDVVSWREVRAGKRRYDTKRRKKHEQAGEQARPVKIF